MLPEMRSMRLEIMTRVQRVTVLQYSLSYIDIADDVRSFWGWVMKKRGVEDSWTLLFRVDASKLDWPVGFRMNVEFVMEANQALVSYDPESKQNNWKNGTEKSRSFIKKSRGGEEKIHDLTLVLKADYILYC
ncbi:hypothetical protein Vadar_018313 [Vaccinium darrowii]|uniref:Uncharacterized protein n=1 Tax=Vaccinium darrowii TaxID=229202 RepID=A0ACB7XSZ0_9ERIC|nr:hypothetical protein Vadar_018313 [Vaccinium darrowii]